MPCVNRPASSSDTSLIVSLRPFCQAVPVWSEMSASVELPIQAQSSGQRATSQRREMLWCGVPVFVRGSAQRCSLSPACLLVFVAMRTYPCTSTCVCICVCVHVRMYVLSYISASRACVRVHTSACTHVRFSSSVPRPATVASCVNKGCVQVQLTSGSLAAVRCQSS